MNAEKGKSTISIERKVINSKLTESLGVEIILS